MSADEPGAAPGWDDALARELPGKLLLIGITRLDADGVLVSQQQFSGRVVSADARSGIRLTLEGSRSGEAYTLPPDTRALYPARAGQYRLRSTGEVVEDPDFLVTYELVEPRRH